MSKLFNLLPLLILLIIWEVYIFIYPSQRFLLSSPSEILTTFSLLIAKTDTWTDIGYTSSATICGLLIGTFLGSLFGLTLALLPGCRNIVRSYLFCFGAVPIFALAPIVVLWLGVLWQAKVILAAIGTSLLAVQMAYAGALQTETENFALLRTIPHSRFNAIRFLLLPGSLKWVMEGYKANIGAALLGVFLGETLSSSHGVGHMIQRASGLYRISEVWCGVLIFVLISLAISKLSEKGTLTFSR